MKTKIYALMGPDSSDVRYVGKTIGSLNTRITNHIYRARSGRSSSRTSQWILDLLHQGQRPEIGLLDVVQGDWKEAERHWISQFDNLLNQTPGGNGSHHRVVLDDETLALLGVISDSRIAEKVGCSREFIGYERRKRGIPASGDRSRVKPPTEGRPKIQLEPWVVEALGAMTDTELSEKAGVSTTTIWARRKELGIPSFAAHHRPPVHKGTGHHNSKLTWEIVREMRDLHSSGETQRALADRFDVHISTVNSVVHRKTWRENDVTNASGRGV